MTNTAELDALKENIAILFETAATPDCAGHYNFSMLKPEVLQYTRLRGYSNMKIVCTNDIFNVSFEMPDRTVKVEIPCLLDNNYRLTLLMTHLEKLNKLKKSEEYMRTATIRANALAKLTDEELDVLGLSRYDD